MNPDKPCPDCGTDLEYDRMAPRRSGYAIILACPICGEEVADERDATDARERQYR